MIQDHCVRTRCEKAYLYDHRAHSYDRRLQNHKSKVGLWDAQRRLATIPRLLQHVHTKKQHITMVAAIYDPRNDFQIDTQLALVRRGDCPLISFEPRLTASPIGKATFPSEVNNAYSNQKARYPYPTDPMKTPERKKALLLGGWLPRKT